MRKTAFRVMVLILMGALILAMMPQLMAAQTQPQPGELVVTKECRPEVDPATGLFIYDVTISNTALPGAASLYNCMVTDTSASGCDTVIPSLAPGQSQTVTCMSEFYTNTTIVTCEDPNGQTITREASAECPVDVDLDKQVSCDSGMTWHDVGSDENVVEGCTGLSSSDPNSQVMVRYFAKTTGYLENCMLFDTNTVFVPAAGIAVSSPPGGIDGQIFQTVLTECNDTQPGWSEPNTATLSCDCLRAPGVTEQVIGSDTANIECEQIPDPELVVTKECRPDVDSQTGLFIYDVTIANTASPGAASLYNVMVTDTSASGCDTVIQSLAPGQSETVTCMSEFYTNTTIVTCEGPNGQTITGEASAECPVDVLLDKQVSCDSGITWSDMGYNDSVAERCTGLSSSDPDSQVLVRYFAKTTGYLENCMLFDTNTVFVPAAGIAVPSPPGGIDGQIFQTALTECNDTQPGWSEPNTATLSCECLSAPGVTDQVTGSDTANIECQEASVDVTKECSSNNGDGTYTYNVYVTNTGEAPLENCTLIDTNPVPADCGPLTQTSLAPGETATAQCTSERNYNSVTVICDIEGSSKTVTDEAMAGCVDLDKQVSCDSGMTWSDMGYNDSVAERCTGCNTNDPNDPNDPGLGIVFRYMVRTGGAMTQCVLTDSNPAIPPAPPIGALPSMFDGEVFRTHILTCDGVEPGEPGTATLTCIPVADEPGDPTPSQVTDEDSADLECQTACVPCQDTDDDGVCDDDDNCPGTANPNQEDADSDGIGDVCDDCTDVDQDTVCDDVDNCPGTSNPNQDDADSDGIGDACDDCNDVDNDGVCNEDDNCINTPNRDQLDSDNDEFGDECDNCPYTYNPNQQDTDGDGTGDVCETTPPVPEIATIVMLSLGLLALSGFVWFKRRRQAIIAT